MRLPALDPSTLIPNGITFDPVDYFNPSINNYYQSINNSITNEGRILVSQVIELSKAVLNTASIDDLFPQIARAFGGDSNIRLQLPCYKLAYESMPDGYKHFIFNMTFTPISQVGRDTERNGDMVYKFRCTLYRIHGISYYESTTEFQEFFFNVNIDSSTATYFTPEQTEEFKALFSDPATYEAAANSFAARMAKQLYTGDRFVPITVSNIYLYTRDQPILRPKGSHDDFDVSPDVYRPSAFLTLQTAGNRFGFYYENNKAYYTQILDPNSRRRYERVLNYSTDVLGTLNYTIKGEKEPTAVLYGVELEANGEYTPKEIITAQKELFFLLKQDSSISGRFRQNYEMVTVPCSLRAHKRLWAEFFDKVDYTKFDTSRDTSNGMHIHIGAQVFEKTPGHRNRFTWFFINPAHSQFILEMSERKNMTDLSRYSRIADVAQEPDRYYNTAQVAESINRGRGAIHYKGPTVEVRIFKGIVSYATIVKNLEFVDSVLEYTRTVSLAKLSLSDYLTWLRKTPKNQYEMLKTYLVEIKVSNLETAATLDTYLWGHRDDHVITEKLNKAPFKVTNAHLTILNKRKRKRTFILKDGVVTCVSKGNGGVLAKLDQIAQKKQTRGAASFVSENFR